MVRCQKEQGFSSREKMVLCRPIIRAGWKHKTMPTTSLATLLDAFNWAWQRASYHFICLSNGLLHTALHLRRSRRAPLALKQLQAIQMLSMVCGSQVLANFMAQVCGGKARYSPDQMVLTVGATAAVEVLAFALADPGDAIVLLALAYPGFDKDIGYRSQVRLLPVQTSSKNSFLVTREALEQAFKETEGKGQRVKGILMTSPSNPIGATYEKEYLVSILKFVQEKDIHLICDEIYAGSDFGGPEFVSVAELVTSPLFETDKVHIISGLSKTLGVPGFCVGWLYSWNNQVLSATRSLTRFSAIFTHTQQLFVMLLSDTEFIQKYLSENKKNLRERWDLVCSGLLDAGIEFIEATCGFFCWVSMRNFFPPDIEISEQQELELWKRLLYEVGVNITPGSACCCNERGWFRICFTFVDEKVILVALDHLQEFAASIERDKLSRAKYARLVDTAICLKHVP